MHEGVETLIGLCMPCGGEVERDHGRFELRMSQGTLDASGMHAGFEERGGVRMPEGRDGDAPCGHAGLVCGGTDGALDTATTHGGGRGRTVVLIAPGGGTRATVCDEGFPRRCAAER